VVLGDEMNNADFPFIVVELVMTLGGALAFGWWQLRDLKKERLKRERAEAESPKSGGNS
jgi:hypothetical protein